MYVFRGGFSKASRTSWGEVSDRETGIDMILTEVLLPGSTQKANVR